MVSALETRISYTAFNVWFAFNINLCRYRAVCADASEAHVRLLSDEIEGQNVLMEAVLRDESEAVRLEAAKVLTLVLLPKNKPVLTDFAERGAVKALRSLLPGRIRVWPVSLDTPYDAIYLKTRGFKMRDDDVAGTGNGPVKSFSPRYRMPFDSRNEGSGSLNDVAGIIC
jgi:hypothetical protein